MNRVGTRKFLLEGCVFALLAVLSFSFFFFVNVTINKTVNQGLSFQSTIVQREFTHIAYALLFSRRSDSDKHTCQRML